MRTLALVYVGTARFGGFDTRLFTLALVPVEWVAPTPANDHGGGK